MTPDLERLARERGLCFAFGSFSGVPEPFDIRLLNKKSVTLANPGVQHYIATRDDLVLSSDRVFSALRDGTIAVGDPHQLTLSEIRKVMSFWSRVRAAAQSSR